MEQTNDQTVVITVVGRDTIGIIARVSQVLYDCHVNIKDISQTIMEDIFTMIMLVDMSKSTLDIKELSDRMDELGKEIGLSILLQRSDLFNAMHRI